LPPAGKKFQPGAGLPGSAECNGEGYDGGVERVRRAEPPEVVLLIGLPGAGKTTFFRERFTNSHEHVSRDLVRRTRASQPAQQLQMVERALSQGRSVVVDNTHPRRADRAPYLVLARRLGARVIGYHFDEPAKACLARNRGRSGEARVPPVAIFTAAKRMEPPSPDEGFDALYRVTVTPGGGFVVEARTPDLAGGGRQRFSYRRERVRRAT
jgi:predicted kinase